MAALPLTVDVDVMVIAASRVADAHDIVKWLQPLQRLFCAPWL
jgi:hypothetical protein